MNTGTPWMAAFRRIKASASSSRTTVASSSDSRAPAWQVRVSKIGLESLETTRNLDENGRKRRGKVIFRPFSSAETAIVLVYRRYRAPLPREVRAPEWGSHETPVRGTRPPVSGPFPRLRMAFRDISSRFCPYFPIFFIIFDANWGAGGGEAAGSDSPGALEAAELHEARRAHCDHLTFRLFSVAEKAFHVRFRGLRG